jgi:DNA primase
MGIVEEDIARVRAATDFVGLASEHVALRRVGQRWTALCPFHVEKSPSFSLNAQEGLYYCFGCQAKGDVITFVRELEHLDFAEAVEKLAGRAGITLHYDDEATGRDHQRLSRIYDTVARAMAWYHEQLLEGRDSSEARHYLRAERGYDGDVVRHYQLGWAPEGWDRLLRSIKLPRDALVDAGLAQVDDEGRYRDFFRGRLLFPIFEPGGRAIGAGGRMLPGGRPPKYKNTAGTAVYDKSKVVYGLNWAKQTIVQRGQIVMCEGYTDVIGLQRAGVGEAVATCGTALADGHIRLLTKFARRIILAYDADAAGQAAAERYYAWEQRYEVDIRVAALPAGSDPADLARRDPAALSAAITEARPFLSFQLERLFSRAEMGTAEGRVRAGAVAMGFVRAHPNDLVRDQYVMEVADRCRIDPDRLRSLPVAAPGSFVGAGTAVGAGSAAGAGAAAGSGSWAGAGAAAGAERGGRQDRSPAATPDRELEAVALSGPEVEALRLAVHRPEEVADRLDLALFGHPLSRSAFRALASADTLHDAIDDADPQTADLLQRLAVEESEEDTDDVMVRLMEVAGGRARADLLAEMRAAPAAEQGAYVATRTWVQLAVEELRTPDGSPVGRRVDPELKSERRLVAWLVERDEIATEASSGSGEAGVDDPHGDEGNR